MFRARDNSRCAARSLRLMLVVVLSLSGSLVQAGLKIVPTFDASINARPNAPGIRDCVNRACAFYATKFTDNITVNITFQDMVSGLGQSQKPLYTMPYNQYIAALRKEATSPNDTKAIFLLPQTNAEPVQNQPNIIVTQANMKALGFTVPAVSDGTISLNTRVMFSSNSDNFGGYDMYATVCHEINDVLGLGSGIGFPASVVSFYRAAIMPEDLFRYDGTNARSFTTDSSVISYFSLDSFTFLNRFNQSSGGDYSDWYSGFTIVMPQVQDAFATRGVNVNRAMTKEVIALDVIGYNVSGFGNPANSLSAASAKSIGNYNSYQKPQK